MVEGNFSVPLWSKLDFCPCTWNWTKLNKKPDNSVEQITSLIINDLVYQVEVTTGYVNSQYSTQLSDENEKTDQDTVKHGLIDNFEGELNLKLLTGITDPFMKE